MLEVVPRAQTLAGIPILRVLPYRLKRHVGPFVFVDHIGPHTFAAGSGMAILPHPHIGLSTITYVFEGAIVHRDGLGTVQTLKPGEVNWMQTGRGLAHSERTPEADIPKANTLQAVQVWMVLPEAQRESAPSFVHLQKEALPKLQCGAAELRLLGGALQKAHLPVPKAVSAFYADVSSTHLGAARLPHPEAEAGFYLVSGAVNIAGQIYDTPRLFVFAPDEPADVTFVAPTRALWLGGPQLRRTPVMWWNFVAGDSARIEAAKQDWVMGRFADVPGELERMALPDLPAPAPAPEPL